MKLPENNTFFSESKHRFLNRKVTPVSSSCFHQENRLKLNLLLHTITDLCDYMGQEATGYGSNMQGYFGI